jgi:hypothetical protein
MRVVVIETMVRRLCHNSLRSFTVTNMAQHDPTDGSFREGDPPLPIARLRDDPSARVPSPAKLFIAKASFGLSLGLFFLGILVACYCPGWYATAAALAGIGLFLGTGRIRIWSTVSLVASLIFTGIHYELKVAEQKRFEEIRQRIQQERSTSEQGDP